MPVGVVKPSNRFKLLNPSSNEPGRHNTDRCHWGAVPYIATGWGLDGGAVVGMDFTRLLLYDQGGSPTNLLQFGFRTWRMLQGGLPGNNTLRHSGFPGDPSTQY
eukprot:jgi/Chrzof1/4097/Cz13g20080.t1